MSIKVCGQYLIKSTIKSFGTLMFQLQRVFVALNKQKINGLLAVSRCILLLLYAERTLSTSISYFDK